MNPDESNKDRYLGIVSNTLDLPSKVIFYANKFHASGHLYGVKSRKLGGKKRLVTTDGKERCMLISDGLAYLPIRWPTDEYMESYTKVILNPAGEWKSSYLDDDSQWEYSDDDMSSGANVSVTRYTQSNDVLEPILSAPQYKAPTITFVDDVASTKGATDDGFFSDIP